MAEFTSSALPDPTPNVLTDIPGSIAAGQKLQANALLNMGTQQNLTDRQTFRDNAGGMLARDPNATALAIGADPSAALSYVQSIPQMDQNTRVQAASDSAANASFAGSLLNAPPAARPSLYAQGRQQLLAAGHNPALLPEQYPGDTALLATRTLGLTAQDQLEKQAQTLSTTPTSPLMTIPGGASPASGAGGSSPSTSAGAMAQSESGGNASAVNAQGFAGKYQFGTGALIDQKMYTPAPGENPNGNQWKGQLAIPGYPQVKTLRDFLADPDAQDAAYGAHVDRIDGAIANTPGANKYDPSGLVAVAHIGGITGMQNFVKTGGQYNPADRNGTSLMDYYKKFSGHDPGAMLTHAQQAGSDAVQQFVQGGGRYTPGMQPPAVQLASNTGAAGMQPTATDAPTGLTAPPALPAAPVPSAPVSAAAPAPTSSGFNRMISGLYAPPAPPISGQAGPDVSAPPVSSANATGQPQPPALPSAAGPPSSGTGGLASSGSPNRPNPMVSSSTQPGTLQTPQPGQNALASLPFAAPDETSFPRNALAGPLPSAPAAQPSGGALNMQPLFQGNSYVPAPNLPGYVLGLDANGNRGVMRLPGAPPAKPPETKFIGGSMVQLDGTDGHVINLVPGMVPDPSRMTQVTGAGPNGQNGTVLMQDGKPAGFVPASTQPIQMAAYQADLGRAGQVAQQSTDAEQQVQRALEARNYANGLPTGAGGEDRAALSTWMKTYAPDQVYQGFVKSGWLPDAPQAEAAAKVMLGQAAMDEKTMGGSGGLGLTEKYAKANPSLNMTPPAIQAMSNLKAVTAQSAKDYSDGYLQFFNKNAADFSKSGGTYQPAANFDQQWHAQPNVQTYMAAIDAMNQKPFAQWSKGLSSDVQQRAIGVIGRVDPTSIINGANGRIGVTGRIVAPAAPEVGTVQGGYRFNGGDPSSPASWGRAQ